MKPAIEPVIRDDKLGMEAASAIAIASPFVATALLDFQRLLAPIPGDSPAGSDLREASAGNSLFHRLRELRATARNNERAALANGEAGYIAPADWAEILELAPGLLSDHSKDLDVTAWLIEALTRIHGFAGVAAGFSLAQQLLQHYGEQLWPRPDEHGVNTQLATLTGLNGFGSEGALIAPLKSIPLTEGAPPGPFSTWQCEQAFETDRIGDEAKRAARSKRGFVLRSDIEKAVAETSSQFFHQLYTALEAARAAFTAYQQTIDQHASSAPQPTARLRDTLDTVAQTLRHIAGDKLTSSLAASAEDCAELEEPTSASDPLPVSQQLTDRQAALQQLRSVAAFFRRTEPHSPISYAVEQAIHWSGLSLPELIGSLIPDDAAREKFKTLTGIRGAD